MLNQRTRGHGSRQLKAQREAAEKAKAERRQKLLDEYVFEECFDLEEGRYRYLVDQSHQIWRELAYLGALEHHADLERQVAADGESLDQLRSEAVELIGLQTDQAIQMRRAIRRRLRAQYKSGEIRKRTYHRGSLNLRPSNSQFVNTLLKQSYSSHVSAHFNQQHGLLSQLTAAQQQYNASQAQVLGFKYGQRTP